MKHIIILVRPETSGNIGAVCRAMASSGLSYLRIIGNRENYDTNEIEKFALAAFNIWDNAKFFSPSIEALKDATSDSEISFGLTRRTGKKRTSSFQSISHCAKSVFEKDYSKAAFVFGNERTGLSKEELEVCNETVYIPTSKNFGSLNLSHAVQIVGYELFQNALYYKQESPEKNLAKQNYTSQTKIENLSKSIIENLLFLNFFKAGGADENKKFFSQVLTRCQLTESEAEHLEQLLKKLKIKLSKKQDEI